MEYTQRDFLKTVLPENGLVAIGRLAPAKGSFFNHDIYDSVDSLLDALGNANTTRENFYFAVASFSERSVIERGKQRFRTQGNARSLRCIILDVDVKSKDGYYTDKEQAWEGIHRVTMQMNLPDPIVVDSGFGYHVYWPMVASVPAKEWQAVAKLFYTALSILEPRIVADASRVSDSASVLRIPGTYNLKFDQQTPVHIVQWYSDVIDFGDFRETLQRITGKRPGAPTVSLETNNTEYEKVPLVGTIKNCNWLANYVGTAATASEPEWYAALGLAPFIEHKKADGTVLNGVDVAHMLSKNHPTYTHDGTVMKFHQVKHGQSGPTTCGKLQQINAKPCETCPFRGAVKTPVQTARLSRPATADTIVTTTVVTDDGNKSEEDITIPRPPSPYFRGESGGVYARIKEKVTKDGKEDWEEKIVKIYDYDLYPVKRFRSELQEEEQLEVHLWLPKDGMRRFKMPTETLVEHKRLGTYLASRGAIGEAGSSIRMSKYMIDYARHLQQEASAEVEYSRFGWRDVNGADPKFVVGNGYIDKAGTEHPAAFPAYLKGAATAVAAYGDLEKWKVAFNVYNKIPNSEAFIFTAMMGFASPLMALTPYAGVLFNMVADGGAGKSAALSMMTSVWGQPNPQRVLVTDTQIATYNTIGYLNSVPVAFDEITNMDAVVAGHFALNFTGGRGKERAGRDGQNKENHVTWDTIVVCTSNTSMYSKFTAARRGYNAEAMRLFEVNVPKSSDAHKSVMDAALSIVQSNYGLAGRAYIGAVMRNRERLGPLIEGTANNILKETGGSNAERFWATLLACVYIGGSLAQKEGLHTYDMARCKQWAMNQMNIVRESSGKAAADPKAMLGEFLNSNLEHMVRIRDGQVDLKVQASAMRNIKGRLEYEGDVLKTAMISSKALTDYCNNSNIDSSWLITELTRLGVTNGIAKTTRLATGTNFPNTTIRAFNIDLTKQGETDGQSA